MINHTGHHCTDSDSPCRKLRFEVADVDGSPLQDAFVELVDSNGFRIARAATDASGYVRFADISSGQQVQVRVLKRGHASVVRSIIVR
jgi:protocatechuate 3,4-dioxygenase beta subunit